MKATGIIRRVDDLGRIVIPREIRKRIGITEVTPMEIFITDNNDGVAFITYNSYDQVVSYINSLSEAATEIECNDLSDEERVIKIKNNLKELKELFKED